MAFIKINKALTTFLIIVTSISWSSVAQESGKSLSELGIYPSSHKELGKFAVDLMQKIGKISEAEFFEKFISKKFIGTLYEYNKDSKILKEMNAISGQDLYSWQANMYKELRKDGAIIGIDWEDIELVDFIIEGPQYIGEIDVHYITRRLLKNHYEDSIMGAGGWLYWKYNDRVYKSELGAIFVDDDYWLVKLEDAYLQN